MKRIHIALGALALALALGVFSVYSAVAEDARISPPGVGYVVATGNEWTTLIKGVEQHQAEGYVCQGGISVVRNDQDIVWYYQAMVKQ